MNEETRDKSELPLLINEDSSPETSVSLRSSSHRIKSGYSSVIFLFLLSMKISKSLHFVILNRFLLGYVCRKDSFPFHLNHQIDWFLWIFFEG
jgi:hypothetical protein